MMDAYHTMVGIWHLLDIFSGSYTNKAEICYIPIMDVSQNYGVLRVMGIRRVHQTGRGKRMDSQPSAVTLMGQEGYQLDWLSEERFVHVISRREMTIGQIGRASCRKIVC